MIMGVIGELRYAMVHAGKPTPKQAARLVTRFLQGGLTGFTTRAPRFDGLVSDEFREVLQREAEVCPPAVQVPRARRS